MDKGATGPAVGDRGTPPSRLHPQVPSRPLLTLPHVVQPPSPPPPTFVQGLRCSPAGRLCTASLSNRALRRWADPWPRRVERLQGIAPPVWDNVSGISTHQLLFIHIPKCAGSSFRNGAPRLVTRRDASATRRGYSLIHSPCRASPTGQSASPSHTDDEATSPLPPLATNSARTQACCSSLRACIARPETLAVCSTVTSTSVRGKQSVKMTVTALPTRRRWAAVKGICADDRGSFAPGPIAFWRMG